MAINIYFLNHTLNCSPNVCIFYPFYYFIHKIKTKSLTGIQT